MKIDWQYLAPKYWKVWLFLVIARLFVYLPYRWQMRFGRGLGRASYRFIKRRKAITLTNLSIAFPDYTDAQRERLCQKCFESAGMAAVETMIAWFMPEKRFAKIDVTFHGDERVFELHKNKPVMLLGSHFLCMEIIGRRSGQRYAPSFHLIYQKHKNALFETIMTNARSQYGTHCLQRKNVLAIVRALKRNGIVWYAPDQDFSHESTVFVPFFGKLCATLTATAWLAKQTNAVVFPCYYIRRADLSGYDGYVLPAFEDFPSGDDHQDARRYNAFLEEAIHAHPEQYLWQHRRYKTRPPGEPKIY